MAKNILHISLLLFSLSVFSAIQSPGQRPTYTNDESTLVAQDDPIPLSRENITKLNTIANDKSVDHFKRSLAIMALFSYHIKLHSSSSDLRSTFLDASWLQETSIRAIPYLRGWLPIEWRECDSIFDLYLFPQDPPRWNPMSICFRLSGKHDDKDAIDFLNGRLGSSQTKLDAFALNLPNGFIEIHDFNTVKNFKLYYKSGFAD